MTDPQKVQSEGQGSTTSIDSNRPQRNRQSLPNSTSDYPRVYPVRSLLTDVQPDPQGPSPTAVRAIGTSLNVSTTVEGFHHLSNVLEADRDAQQQRSRTIAAGGGEYRQNITPTTVTMEPKPAGISIASTSGAENPLQVSNKPDTLEATETRISTQADENMVGNPRTKQRSLSPDAPHATTIAPITATESNFSRPRTTSDISASRDRHLSSFQPNEPSSSFTGSKSISTSELDNTDSPASGFASGGYVRLAPIPVGTITCSPSGSANTTGVCPPSTASRSPTVRYTDGTRVGETSVMMMPTTGESNVSDIGTPSCLLPSSSLSHRAAKSQAYSEGGDDGGREQETLSMPLGGVNLDDLSTSTGTSGSTSGSGEIHFRTTRFRHVETTQGSFFFPSLHLKE